MGVFGLLAPIAIGMGISCGLIYLIGRRGDKVLESPKKDEEGDWY